MNRLEAEQDAAHQTALERIACLKDEIIDNPIELENSVSTAEQLERIIFFKYIQQLFSLAIPDHEERYNLKKNCDQVYEILDTLSYFADHVEEMVEKYLENNSE